MIFNNDLLTFISDFLDPKSIINLTQTSKQIRVNYNYIFQKYFIENKSNCYNTLKNIYLSQKKICYICNKKIESEFYSYICSCIQISSRYEKIIGIDNYLINLKSHDYCLKKEINKNIFVINCPFCNKDSLVIKSYDE